VIARLVIDGPKLLSDSPGALIVVLLLCSLASGDREVRLQPGDRAPRPSGSMLVMLNGRLPLRPVRDCCSSWSDVSLLPCPRVGSRSIENGGAVVHDNPPEGALRCRPSTARWPGFAEYRQKPGLIAFVHTEVDHAFAGMA